jgi:RNA polymerase sigma factor (sigma-70 family)
MSKGGSKTSLFLKQWHGGDQKSLYELVQRHLPWIHANVRHRMGPVLKKKGETSDYVQDVLIQFMRDSPRFVLSNEVSFRALLLKIVDCTLRDKHDWYTARRRAVARERPLPSDTILDLDAGRRTVRTPSKSAAFHEQEAWIRLGMELLDPEDREVLVLRQWDELSFSEIGKQFGLKANAAWKKHDRAVCRLGEVVSALRSGDVNRIAEVDARDHE